MEKIKTKLYFTTVAQWVFVLWFIIISWVVVHNFNQNTFDEKTRTEQTSFFNYEKEERKAALSEHKYLRERIVYLEGQVDALHKQLRVLPATKPIQ